MASINAFPVWICLAGALLAFIFKGHVRMQKVVGLTATTALLIVSVLIVRLVHQNGIQVLHLGDWQAPFGITFVADYLSSFMLSVTGLIAVAVFLYAWKSEAEQFREGHFTPLFLILLMGVCGSFLAGDLFNLYVWFEVMLIASFVLLTIGGHKSQIKGAVHYVTINLVGSAIFLCGLGILYGKVGTLNMADLAVKLGAAENAELLMSSAVFFTIAFGIKAALFPLFFWLPPSYHTPPIAVSAIFSGLLTKVGVYALIRTFTLIFNQEQGFTGPLLTLVAGLTMVAGVLGAVSQYDIRKILSFHIISQIGYMIMGLALMTPLALAGTVFYLIHHIVVKTNLFLIAGLVAKKGGSFQLKESGGLFRKTPWLAALFLIPALSLAGVPPLSGFFSKFVLIKAGLEVEAWYIVATALGVGVLTLISMMKIWNEAFLKKASPEATSMEDIKIRPSKTLPIAALALVTVSIGILAGPAMELAQLAAGQLLDPRIYINAVLGGEPK